MILRVLYKEECLFGCRMRTGGKEVLRGRSCRGQHRAQVTGRRETWSNHALAGMVRGAEKDVASRPRSDPRAQLSPFQY